MREPSQPTRNERLVAWLWALLLLGCALLLASQIRNAAPFDTRITALLPETRQTPLIEQAEHQLTQAFEDRFVILLRGENPAHLVDDLRQRLEASGSVATFDDATERPDRALAAYRYRLLTEPMARADDSAWTQRALSRLFSPGSNVDLSRDPFGLLDAWLSRVLDGPVRPVDGLPAVADEGGHWFLVSGQLAASPYDMSLQRSLVESLAGFREAYPEAELLRGGLVFHAAFGANQAKREISTIGLGSLLGVLLLLWGVFRRGSTLFSLLLPVASGLLFALPLTWALYGTLNLLTLAFGASLIGIAVDYALHLQCARLLSPARPLKALWPGLWMGLVSSLAAYLIQLATPLPGLHQMATFAALGLLGAWLTVRLWLPHWAPHPHPATAKLAERLDRLRLPLRAPLRWSILAILGVAAFATVALHLTADNDLRQLNPSPPQLILEQQRVQALLQQPSGSHYLIVTADREDILLERLEALDIPLATLSEQGHLAGYRHLAQVVPSPATQQANLTRVRQAYANALPLLIERAGLPGQLQESAMANLDSVPLLTSEEWLKMPMGHADNRLWLGDGSMADGDESAALVVLGDADDIARQALVRLADAPHVHYEDRVAALSSHLAELRNTIALWLAAAMAGLSLVFGWRYRGRAWRVLLPPLGAVAATLALLGALGVGLTLFHLLGLLLVLGIGLDAGIFSTEHPDSSAAWLAISLSCGSSLLAFGLLAFSATPALHFLGVTCLVGLAATWALVPFARARTRRDASTHAIHDAR